MPLKIHQMRSRLLFTRSSAISRTGSFISLSLSAKTCNRSSWRTKDSSERRKKLSSKHRKYKRALRKPSRFTKGTWINKYKGPRCYKTRETRLRDELLKKEEIIKENSRKKKQREKGNNKLLLEKKLKLSDN